MQASHRSTPMGGLKGQRSAQPSPPLHPSCSSRSLTPCVLLRSVFTLRGAHPAATCHTAPASKTPHMRITALAECLREDARRPPTQPLFQLARCMSCRLPLLGAGPSARCFSAAACRCRCSSRSQRSTRDRSWPCRSSGTFSARSNTWSSSAARHSDWGLGGCSDWGVQ